MTDAKEWERITKAAERIDPETGKKIIDLMAALKESLAIAAEQRAAAAPPTEQETTHA